MSAINIRVVVSLMMLLSVSAAHAEIAVEPISRSTIDRIAHAPGFEVQAFFADHTFIMKARNSHPSYPFDGRSFVYFGPNGKLALWRPAVQAVHGGNWEAGWLGDNEVLLCLDFDGFSDGRPCIVLKSAITLFGERAAGNVFGLKGGAQVPLFLQRQHVDFDFVAEKLGL